MLSRIISQSLKLPKFLNSSCPAAFYFTSYFDRFKHKDTFNQIKLNYHSKYHRSHSHGRYFRNIAPSGVLLAGGIIASNDKSDDSYVDANIIRYISPVSIVKSDTFSSFSPESTRLTKPTFQAETPQNAPKEKSSTKNYQSSKAFTEGPKQNLSLVEELEEDDDFEDFEDEVPPLPEYVSSVIPAAFPDFVPYIIIGGGTTGMAAARAIRASDPTSQVLIISSESAITNPGCQSLEEFYPYLRPPLSKDLWRRSDQRQVEMMEPKGDMKKHSWLYYEPDNFFLKPENLRQYIYGGIAFWKGRKVTGLDVSKREAILDNGHKIAYNQCLLATGSRPKRLNKFEICSSSGADLMKQGKVSYFRSMNDFKQLQKIVQTYSEKGGRIAIIGGGFLGTELAMSLGRMAKKSDKLKVLQIYRELGNYSHTLPPYLAAHTRDYLHKNEVTVRHMSQVTGIHLSNNGKLTLNVAKTSDKSEVDVEVVDHVVVALGVEANTDFAKDGHLEVDPILGGYLVNSELEARSGVYVAGDAASYFDPLLGRRRVEHINHAEESGQIAGKNMAASNHVKSDTDNSRITNWSRTEYTNQSSFWSTLGPDLAFEAVGLTDARNLVTHAYLAFECDDVNPDVTIDSASVLPNYEYPGVIFYSDPTTKKIVGVVLWNLPDELYSDSKYFAPSRLNLARKLLADQIVVESEEQLSQLARDFDIYETVDDEFQELKKKMESRIEEEAKELESKHNNPESN